MITDFPVKCCFAKFLNSVSFSSMLIFSLVHILKNSSRTSSDLFVKNPGPQIPLKAASRTFSGILKITSRVASCWSSQSSPASYLIQMECIFA